jgi:hypothetical protein
MSAGDGEPEATASKRHVALSRIKYAAANPGHTVRFKPQTHAKILAMCEQTGLSYNQVVNSAVNGLDEAMLAVIRARGEELGYRKGVSDAQAEARAAGFAEAAKLFRLTFPCPKCRHQVALRAGDPLALATIAMLIASGLAHQDGCPTDAR